MWWDVSKQCRLQLQEKTTANLRHAENCSGMGPTEGSSGLVNHSSGMRKPLTSAPPSALDGRSTKVLRRQSLTRGLGCVVADCMQPTAINVLVNAADPSPTSRMPSSLGVCMRTFIPLRRAMSHTYSVSRCSLSVNLPSSRFSANSLRSRQPWASQKFCIPYTPDPQSSPNPGTTSLGQRARRPIQRPHLCRSRYQTFVTVRILIVSQMFNPQK
ncbi:hypothetical protein C7212DRAFT_346571 [Tuber magnatum]|uniref:Uncharacterized protein n=1 Tax=Tuber magnatum TaxID=42249 RepID=A0A317SJD4_9PEZI|nr:hypothetical protein C7212DRAFT_346571 [Tuber magnatum]